MRTDPRSRTYRVGYVIGQVLGVMLLALIVILFALGLQSLADMLFPTL